MKKILLDAVSIDRHGILRIDDPELLAAVKGANSVDKLLAPSTNLGDCQNDGDCSDTRNTGECTGNGHNGSCFY